TASAALRRRAIRLRSWKRGAARIGSPAWTIRDSGHAREPRKSWVATLSGRLIDGLRRRAPSARSRRRRGPARPAASPRSRPSARAAADRPVESPANLATPLSTLPVGELADDEDGRQRRDT